VVANVLVMVMVMVHGADKDLAKTRQQHTPIP